MYHAVHMDDQKVHSPAGDIGRPTLPYIDPESGATQRLHTVPWEKKRVTMLIVAAAVVVQSGILAVGAYLSFKRFELPSRTYLSRAMTVKNYNVLISLLSNVVALLTSTALALGAESHVSRQLVGSGINLRDLNFWQAIGAGSRARGYLSVRAFASVAVIVLLANSNPAYTALFSAAPDRPAKYELNLQYPTLAGNAAITPEDFLTVPLLDLTDYNSFLEQADWNVGVVSRKSNVTLSEDQLLQTIRASLSSVDGVLTNTASGVVPALRLVSTLTSLISDNEGPGKFLSQRAREVITSSPNNTYTVTLPVASANITCFPSTMEFTTPVITNAANGVGLAAFNVTSPQCVNSTRYPFLATDSWSAYSRGGPFLGMLSCEDRITGNAVIDYFMVTDGNVSTLATCQGSVQLGDVADITYADSRSPSNPVSYAIPLPVQMTNVSSVGADAAAFLASKWVGEFSELGSPALNSLFDAISSLASPEYQLRAMEIISEGLLAMSAAKLVNSVAFFEAFLPGVLTDFISLTPYSSIVRSPALQIGPDGYSRFWLLIVAGILLLLLLALYSVVRFCPVSLNPLDPVGIMLVATNSSQTHVLDGGCTGDVTAIAQPRERVRLRAVSKDHLALVWGDSVAPPPSYGQQYGRLGPDPTE